MRYFFFLDCRNQFVQRICFHWVPVFAAHWKMCEHQPRNFSSFSRRTSYQTILDRRRWNQGAVQKVHASLGETVNNQKDTHLLNNRDEVVPSSWVPASSFTQCFKSAMVRRHKGKLAFHAFVKKLIVFHTELNVVWSDGDGSDVCQ